MTVEHHDVIDSAQRFAKALDREDYSDARRYLSASCAYEFRGRTINGADAIIAVYRANAESARDRFDTIVYESSVVLHGEREARVDYVDVVTLDGQTHRHRCRQVVRVNGEGSICWISHVDLDGERESLQRFVERHS